MMNAKRSTEGAGVYVLHATDLPPWRIKIGVTTDIRARFATLQSTSSSELNIVLFRPGATAIFERSLHDMFAAERLHGEWFQLAVDDMDVLAKAMSATLHAIRPKPKHERRTCIGRCVLCGKNVMRRDKYIAGKHPTKRNVTQYRHVDCRSLVRAS